MRGGPVLPGVVIGVVTALVILIEHIGRPPGTILGRTPDGEWRDVEIAADAEQVDGLVVYRQELPIVFLNARRTADRLRRLATDDVRVVLLDATAISSFDSSGFDAMVAVRDELHEHGIELWTVNPSIRGAASVDEEARIEDVAPPRRFHHLDEALAAFEQLDGEDE